MKKYIGPSFVLGLIGLLSGTAAFIVDSYYLACIAIFFFIVSGILNTNCW